MSALFQGGDSYHRTTSHDPKKKAATHTIPELGEGEEEHTPPPPPPLHTRIRRWFKRAYRKLGLNHLIPLLIIFIYTIIGAAIFQALEYSNDLEKRVNESETYKKAQNDFLLRMQEILVDRNTVDIRLAHVKELMETFENTTGISAPSNESVWHFWNALYFSGTLYTTIGYGNIACATTGGQIMTMVYALIGIPLVLSALNDLGKWLFKTIHKCVELGERLSHWIQLQWQLHRTGTLEPVGSLKKGPVLPSDDPVRRPSMQAQMADSICIPIEEGVDISMGSVVEVESDVTTFYSEDLDELLEEEFDEEPPKIPVSVALGVTVGWIFLISALFLLWEDWSYFTSIYFFYISLTTIGLGDVTPEHTEYMVINFGFVIVGLALVSMCINVIQQKLEDLYLQLLLMILKEYQKQMASGGDQMDATMGMMNAWNGNKTAKFLLPLLGKDKKNTITQKFQEEAKAQGITVPPILQNVDSKTGMPKILNVKKEEKKEDKPVEEAIREVITKAENKIPPEPEIPIILPKTMYDAKAQTEIAQLNERYQQTDIHEVVEEYAQTTISNLQHMDTAVQTLRTKQKHVEIQTGYVEQSEEETQTLIEIFTEECDTQTTIIQTQDQELQSHVYDLASVDSQTDTVPGKNKRIQTPVPEFDDKESQTDDPPEEEIIVAKNVGFQTAQKGLASAAKKKFRRAFGKKPLRRQGSTSRSPSRLKSRGTPSMANYLEEDVEEELEEEEEEDEEVKKETLVWDPIDGKHAEKQKRVSDLKAMFDK